MPPIRRTSSQSERKTVQVKVNIARRKAMKPCGSNGRQGASGRFSSGLPPDISTTGVLASPASGPRLEKL